MTINLYSVTALTASFLKLFTQNERCIVNLTSLYAVQPGKGVVHYCVGKASREMYFKVLAAENPELNILSYSPGEFFLGGKIEKKKLLMSDGIKLNVEFYRSNRYRHVQNHCRRLLARRVEK